MKRVLGLVLMGSALTGCGGDDAAVVAAPTPTPCVAPTPIDPAPRTLSEFSREERQTMTNQWAIEEVVDEAVEPYREDLSSGFAGVRVDLQALSAEISWKGAPPADVAALPGTAANCVRVNLVQVPFSRADIDRAQRAVAEAVQNGRLPRVSGISPADNFSGLEVGFPATELAEQDTAANRQAFSEAAGMPVEFAVIEGDTALAAPGSTAADHNR